MIAIVDHPIILVLFFTVPITGYYLHVYFSRKTLSYILYTTIILFLPVLIGYYYVIPFIGSVLLYITLACGYAYIASKQNYNLVKSLLYAAALYLVLNTIGGFGAMMVLITIEKNGK